MEWKLLLFWSSIEVILDALPAQPRCAQNREKAANNVLLKRPTGCRFRFRAQDLGGQLEVAPTPKGQGSKEWSFGSQRPFRLPLIPPFFESLNP